MAKKHSYYQNLSADFSRPGLVSEELANKLLEQNKAFHGFKQNKLPEINSVYSKQIIEAENKEWFPTHCQSLRSGRFDLLSQEYCDDYVYLCQDGPFYGKENEKEKDWVAIIAQPGVTMCWPIIMFKGEVVYFEWNCNYDITNEIIAKGNVTFLRRGHRGAIYLKTEQLTFYRDVSASKQLLNNIEKELMLVSNG